MKKLATLLIASTALAGAVHAEGITEFRIGILGGENAQDRLTSNACYAKKIEEALGVPVKLFTPADYDGVIQGLLGGSLDLAWLGASAFAKIYLTDPNAVDLALIKENLNGSTGYYSFGFARKDSGIKTLMDTKGKVFGFGDPNSTSGYLIPSVEIPSIIGASMKPGDFFGDVKFTGGHEQTIVAVANGDIDAGVSWADGVGAWEDGYNSGAFRRAVDSGLVDMNNLVQIWKSNPIPEGPMVVRAALPADVKAKVIKLTADLHETDKDCAYGVAGGEAKDFIPVKLEEYKSIIAARKLKSK